jgi:diguanylate cyclase (GGDEF)-like protein
VLKQLGPWLLARIQQLSLWQIVLAFVVLAIVISMGIVLAIDLLWDGKLSAELQFAGVITPLIDGLLIVTLLVMILAELKREAERRERAEQVLRQAQRIAHIGNWSFEVTTGALHWSEEIFHIFELDPAEFEVSYDAFLQRVHPDDRSTVDRTYRRSLETRQPYAVTHRLLMADGRIKHVSEHGATVYDAAGHALRTVGTVQDITERVTLEEELRRLANTDALTGIANRHHFNALLRQELDRSKRYRVPVSLIMFDIDHFKATNDTYGHETGDRVLVHLVTVVQPALRGSDIIARWGGEEFMVLAPHTDAKDALTLAERLRAIVEQTPCGEIRTTISLGVASPSHDISAEALVRCADEYLYRAKAAGRNQTWSEPC